MNMLATRCGDLHLDRCRIGPSTVPDAGTGLFATRNIRAGELITLYPGDALLYWKDGRDTSSSRTCSGVVFGAHIPDEQRDAERVTSESARQYEVCASSTLSCVGDPRRDDNPAYLGHFANDGSVCASVEAVDAYRKATRVVQNADHVTLEGCQLATQATRDISTGDEIFVSYGEGYWLSHLAGIDSVSEEILSASDGEPRRQRRRDLGPTNVPPPRKKGNGGGLNALKKSRAKGKASKKAGKKNGGTGFGRAGRIESMMAPVVFTADVTASTGVCSDGRVRISPSPGKGMGAFAVRALSPAVASGVEGLVRGEHQIGEYRGEVYNLQGLQMRYGRGGAIAEADVEWHAEWSRERQARGVGITGGYVFTVADALDPWSEVLYVDAEDQERATWTRYINHSAKEPNLLVRSSNGLSDARTTLRIVITRRIEAGEELLIDYGPGYDFDEPPVEREGAT